jgi:hypothetical protein
LVESARGAVRAMPRYWIRSRKRWSKYVADSVRRSPATDCSSPTSQLAVRCGSSDGLPRENVVLNCSSKRGSVKPVPAAARARVPEANA